MTEPQLDALRAIGLCGNPPDQTALALMLGYDRSTTSSIVDGLVRRKLVRRAVGADRRRRTLILTGRSAVAIAHGAACAQRSALELFQALSFDEVAALLDALEMVAMKHGTPAPLLEPESHIADPRCENMAAELYRAPHFLMRRCMQIVGALVAEDLAPLGLGSGLQFLVLYIVAACEPVSQAKIGSILCVDKSSMSLVLSLLETAGMIERASDPGDRRCLLSTITPAGLKMLQPAVTRGEKVDDRVFEQLPSGTRELFTRMLARIVASHGGFVS